MLSLLGAGKLRETSMLNRDAVARAVERVLAEWIDATGKKL